MNRVYFLFFFFVFGGFYSSQAQYLPVGISDLEDYYRREQLMGRLDSTLSFSIRPLHSHVLRNRNVYNVGSASLADSTSVFPFDGRKGFVQVLPVLWEQQINTKVPYGWNDGAMIPSKGYQTLISGGVYVQHKYISMQLRPEIVVAENAEYEGFGGVVGPTQDWYNSFGNVIDMPERFGNGSYTKIASGQSYIRFNLDSLDVPLSLGISSENLWWGPGLYNSLTMTNTAPGFPHLTINTTKPVRTAIGSFEAQLVVGRLDSSGYLPSLLGDGSIDHNAQYGIQKPNTWRYFSGLVFSYQPKWLSGLSLGVIRTMVANRSDMGNKLGNYLPYFGSATPLEEIDSEGNIAVNDRPRDQYSTLFFRFMMPKGHMEFYGEYGYRDKAKNMRDRIVQGDYARAYVAGFRKLVDLKTMKGDMLEIGGEITELAASNTIYQRGSRSWYTHPVVAHGYTQKGQVIGAGIGPGSSFQTVRVGWARGIKRAGLQFERLSHDEDLFYWNISDLRRQWADLGLKAYGTWDFGHIVANTTLQYVKSYNYQFKYEFPDDIPNDEDHFWDFKKQRLTNLHIRLGLMYRF